MKKFNLILVIIIFIVICYLIYEINIFLKNKYYENFANNNNNIKEKIKKFEDYIKNTSNLDKNKKFENEDNLYIKELKKEKEKYNYKVLENNKILILLACHIDSLNKFEVIKNNIKYFKKFDICIINSSNLELNENVENYCKNNNINYIEKENDIYLDFGKWYFGLKNINYKKYDYIIFSNDSIYLTHNLNHFINIMLKKNVDLYGYNDSNEINNHYQSYLFGLKSSSINKFINFFEENKKNIKKSTGNFSLIKNTELKLSNYFKSKDCYLKISKFKSINKSNIYFSNDYLYNKLYSNNILPIIKLKQLKE